MNENKTVYAEAADVIREFGWAQGEAVDVLRDKGGPVCLGVALRIALGRPLVTLKDHELLRPLQATMGTDFYSVWNDRPGRTAEDVLLLLKYADADELDTWKSLYGDPQPNP